MYKGMLENGTSCGIIHVSLSRTRPLGIHEIL